MLVSVRIKIFENIIIINNYKNNNIDIITIIMTVLGRAVIVTSFNYRKRNIQF